MHFRRGPRELAALGSGQKVLNLLEAELHQKYSSNTA
jgi:hypothetical protein